MTRKKKRVILLLLLFLLLAVTGMLVWIFFLPKKYTVMYHMSGNRTIESAEDRKSTQRNEDVSLPY